MSRRILLIDADTEFRDTLTQQIGRYRVVVMTEPEADRALALASSDTPDLLIIAVEEPDKSGFKTFQKARKQLAAKMPIVLVTKTMSKDSFTKHRGLKVHADEYIDKRGLTHDELVGKIDNLIGLGDLQEEDVSIPVEDEIPMEIADGDVVLDEQLDDDAAAEFGSAHEMATVGGGDNAALVDSMVSQELDGAFDALLGDDEPRAPRGLPGVSPIPDHVERSNAGAIEVPDEISSSHEAEPVPEPIPEPVPDEMEAAPEAQDMSGIPEPVPHVIPDDAPEPSEQPVLQSEFEEHSIPERIMDGGRSSESYVAVGEEPNVDDLPGAPRDEAVHEAAAVEAADEPVAPAESAQSDESSDESSSPVEDDEIGGQDSLSAIPIVDDDLVSLDDEEVLEEIDEPAREPSQGTPTLAAVAAETSQATPTLAAPAVSEPSGMFPAEHARAKRATGSQASIDLGLDKLAQDAESEQSGVYDRKSLRKIGELERQIAQLKNELERARTQADQAAKGSGRESQFLNLRESNLAKEKELKQVKTALEQQSKELAEAQEKLRQTQHAKQTLETKNAEIEEKLLEDSGKVKELAASLREATAQASQLEQELEVKTKAQSSAEAKLAQLEKDLANERASGAESASVAERKLRAERDQMVVRHKGELAALRAEVEATQELAAGRLREELDAARVAAVEEAVEDTRRKLSAEHADAIAAVEQKHNAELIHIKSEHAGELSRVKNELGGEIERLKGVVAELEAANVAAIAAANEERETALASLQQERDADVAAAQRERDAAIAAIEHERDTALATSQRERETAVNAAKQERDAAVTAAQRERDFAVEAANEDKRSAIAAAEQAKSDALAAAENQRRQEVELLAAKHQAELEAREEEFNEAREREAQSHGQAIAQLKQELDRTVASYETKLSNARNELEQAVAQAQQEKADLAQAQERAIADLKAAQDEELTLMADGARRAAETHRNALADQQTKYESKITDLQEAAAREVSELHVQLTAAKRAAEEAAARHQSEREEAAHAHAAALADLEAKHERAIAIANGEHLKAKAVADAEHKQAIASLKSEADRMLKQLEDERTRAITALEAEREELRMGLSGARDSLKRSEAELAAAINTIAVRNADLRAHTDAITERDKRINELRAELESLEAENANYQEQVLRAYQKIKSDEAMVARARKAMAIALTVLDDEGNPQSSSS